MCKSELCEDYLDTLQITSELLNKRAERKAVTSSQINQLLKLDSPLKNQYERTSRCNEVIFLKEHTLTGEQKVTANYCGKRFCSVCSAIKTAEMINGYFTPISQMPDLHFITLTVKAVKAKQVKSKIREMIKTFTKLKDSMRKADRAISGIRKIECNYNPDADTFNPHFHLIISGRNQAIEIVDRWLSYNPDAVIEAQDISKADAQSLKELFKYSVKSVIGKKFYPVAQDVIYRALSGVRTFQNFGDVQKSSVTVDNSELDVEYQIEDNEALTGQWRTIDCFTWSHHSNTWINDYGEPLYISTIREKVHNMVTHINSC